jgi:hypothetical protein
VQALYQSGEKLRRLAAAVSAIVGDDRAFKYRTGISSIHLHHHLKYHYHWSMWRRYHFIDDHA